MWDSSDFITTMTQLVQQIRGSSTIRFQNLRMLTMPLYDKDSDAEDNWNEMDISRHVALSRQSEDIPANQGLDSDIAGNHPQVTPPEVEIDPTV